MPKERTYGEDSPAVQAHLSITQAVIQRMASNSASCKAWCITLVSAILVIVADKGKPEYAAIAAIPTVLFLALDMYYLALERCLRSAYNNFIRKLHAGLVSSEDLYAVMPSGSIFWTFVKAMGSFSIWPFYLLLIVMLYVTRQFLLS